jgi:hypothetical protein
MFLEKLESVEMGHRKFRKPRAAFNELVAEFGFQKQQGRQAVQSDFEAEIDRLYVLVMDAAAKHFTDEELRQLQKRAGYEVDHLEEARQNYQTELRRRNAPDLFRSKLIKPGRRKDPAVTARKETIRSLNRQNPAATYLALADLAEQNHHMMPADEGSRKAAVSRALHPKVS